MTVSPSMCGWTGECGVRWTGGCGVSRVRDPRHLTSQVSRSYAPQNEPPPAHPAEQLLARDYYARLRDLTPLMLR
jgi:hypothetical protein